MTAREVERLARGDDPLDVRIALAEELGNRLDPRLEGDTFVEVPEGPFLLGTSDDSEGEHKPHEYPQVTLDLPSFEIGRFPVTVAEFRRFVEDGGYRRAELWRDLGWRWRTENAIELPRFFSESERAEWHPYLTSNRPIVGVSFYEAEAFARWSKARLPTEAEWEKAARGPDGQEYPWGSEWIEDAAGHREVGPRKTVPVGVFPRGESQYGALDMVGSIWQWCADVFEARLYDRIDEHDPRGPDEAKLEGHRSVRGGAWNTLRYSLRCANRNSYPATARFSNLGFRLAR